MSMKRFQFDRGSKKKKIWDKQPPAGRGVGQNSAHVVASGAVS